MTSGKLSLAHGIYCCPNIFISFALPASLYCKKNVCVCVCVYIYILTYIYVNMYIYIHIYTHIYIFFIWLDSPQWAMASSFKRFLDHTQRRTTVGRTPLDEWSARRRDLYLKTHNNHNRQTSMSPVRFEPTISAGERPQTHALDRAASGTGLYTYTPM